MENVVSISLSELILLNIYLGSIMFIVGSVVLFFLIRSKIKGISILKISLSIISQLIVSILFSLLVWKLWTLKTDIMFGFVFFPALISELIMMPLILFILSKVLK